MTDVIDAPFPVTTKQAAGDVGGVMTDVIVLGFADKVVITVVQDGRLAQWFHVPLDAAHHVLLEDSLPSIDEDEGEVFDDSLLPLPHLTPVTLLGGADETREQTGQLLAVQIASAITSRNKEEGRMVTVGLGLKQKEMDQQSFMEMLELVGRCL